MSSEATSRRGRDPDVDLRGGTKTAADENGGGVSDDDVFKVLSNRRRREVVEYLHAGDGTASVGDLAEHIAMKENETSLQQLSSYERKRVYVSLYQNHLPVMDDANIVDYAENRKTVRLLAGGERLKPYLEEPTESVANRTVAAVVFAIAAVVLLGSFQVGAFATIPVSGWTLLGTVGLVGLTCFEVYGSVTG
jgi:DNA-binding transcriptional ArsR family regulator